METRFAEPRDAARIAELFSSSFHPDQAQLLIYGCKGAAEYVRMQIAAAIPNAESAYFVAHAPDGLIAAAELRRRPGGLLLGYIAVDPCHRGRRAGAALFAAAGGMSGVNSGRIGLDVFHDNLRARDWYTRLGFVPTAAAEFVELQPPREADDGSAYVAGLPQADLCQERFGFSRFDLITRQATVSVGRMGDDWFRLTDPDAAGSPVVFRALRRLDPRRRIFGVLPADSAPPAQVLRLLAKTYRMETDIAHLRFALTNDRQESLQPA